MKARDIAIHWNGAVLISSMIITMVSMKRVNYFGIC